jgi:hypothetical protein
VVASDAVALYQDRVALGRVVGKIRYARIGRGADRSRQMRRRRQQAGRARKNVRRERG